MDELQGITDKLIILSKEQHKKAEVIKVVYIGEYDISKVAKFIHSCQFFPYYNPGIKEIPEALKQVGTGLNASIKSLTLDEKVMEKAGLSSKIGVGKKAINSPNYFCYKQFFYPWHENIEHNFILNVDKTTGLVKIGLCDANGVPYDYRDKINASHGENMIANMAMMQIEFWLAYFNYQGIITPHTYGTFIM